MICVICGIGEIRAGTAAVTLTSGGMTMVVRSVPALVCQNCAEEFLDDAVSQNIARAADDAKRARVTFQLREYVS